MGLHEKLKHAKISEEIISYVLNKGFSKLDFSLETTKSETTFIITLYDVTIDLEDELKKDLYCERDQELEEYGWDLHSDDSLCTLHTLGLLIDDYKFEKQNDKYIIKFYRYY